VSKIDPELFKQIRSLCEHAGNLVQMGEDEFAISKYIEALILVPDPKSEHSISTFIYTALGEQYFSMREYSEAGKCFLKAYKCPNGENIAQISFRIGQCLEECGERKKAQDYLCSAFLLDGEDLFLKANPKYYKIIRSEVEGTLPEDDELELLREDDEYDLIDNILKSGSGNGSRENYTGYSGGSSDRDVDLYSRPRSGGSNQRRTDLDDEDEDFCIVPDYDDDEDDDYDDRSYGYGYADEDTGEDDDDDYSDDDYEQDEGTGVWAKIVDLFKRFTDLFK